jgi:hypothetical protein
MKYRGREALEQESPPPVHLRVSLDSVPMEYTNVCTFLGGLTAVEPLGLPLMSI